jgi:hypothetical protein
VLLYIFHLQMKNSKNEYINDILKHLNYQEGKYGKAFLTLGFPWTQMNLYFIQNQVIY